MDNGSSPKDPPQDKPDEKDPIQVLNPESSKQENEILPVNSEAETSFTKYLKMLRSEPGAIVSSLLAEGSMWLSLAGFLFLPGSFPQIEIILINSGVVNRETDFTPYIHL